MLIRRPILLAVAVAGVVALSMAVAVGAFGAHGPDHPSKPNHPSKPDHPGKPNHPGTGNHHGRPLIKESLAPSQVSDPKFHNVSPGMVPWVLQRGDVLVKSDGKLRLRVDGLVIPNPPGDGTPGPVTTISVSLYCGADTETNAAATTGTVPISRSGDAQIHTSLTIPSTCLAPVILVHPNGDLTHYIAVDGWR